MAEGSEQSDPSRSDRRGIQPLAIMTTALVAVLNTAWSLLWKPLRQLIWPEVRNTVYLAHLPLPSDAKVSELDNIPYCGKTAYDGGTFLEYPNRVGWPQALPNPGSPSFARYEKTHPSDDRKLEDFLQTWLFFGLLHELLGPTYDESRYVATDDHGATVHTKNLRDDIDAWSNKAAQLTEEQGHTLYLHLQKCLVLANDVLDVSTPFVHPQFNRIVRQSIALLCEAVARVVDTTLPQPDGCNIPFGWGAAYDDTQIVSTMKGNNWCDTDIAIAAKSTSPSSIYFMERMKKPNLARDHTKCDQNECRYLTTNNKTYLTRHVKNGCKCKDITISLDSLASVLEQNALPLLRLDLDGPSMVKVTIEPSNDSKAYVALSHVWADGLGNKTGNSLPTCQLRRLAMLIRGLRGRLPWNSELPEQRDLLFWCDTLCVPIEDLDNPKQTRVRDLAMERMRTVYQQSSYVLVLDRTFEQYHISDIGLTEAAFRIITSPWAQRLWTYQEAVLPKNLLFQFADTVVDLRDIWKYHDSLGKRNVLFYGISMDINGWVAMIRMPFHIEEQPQWMLTLSLVTSSLQGRRVSTPTDEPLCLAVVFNADISRIQKVPKERRMSEFWRVMFSTPTGVPSNMIFTEFPRLRTAGLRWAPSTLLVDSAIEQCAWIMKRESKAPQGRFSENGLLVDFPAFRIRRAHCAVDAALTQAQTELGILGIIQLRNTEGTWYNLRFDAIHDDTSREQVLELMASRDGRLIVLVQAQLDVGGNRYRQTTGLLTKISDDPLEIPVLHSLGIITFTPMQPGEQTPWTQAYDLAMRLRDSGYFDQAQSQPQLQEDSNSASPQPTVHRNTMQELELKLTESASTLCEQDPALVQLCNDMGLQHPQIYLAFLARRILLGNYLTMSETFEADSTWCVD